MTIAELPTSMAISRRERQIVSVATMHVPKSALLMSKSSRRAASTTVQMAARGPLGKCPAPFAK